MDTRMSASCTAFQKGSNSGYPNEREPRYPGTGAGPYEDGLGATLEHPCELLERLLHDRERDDRRREDAVLVVERPFLVHPLVQRVDGRVRQFGIVPHALLEQAGERGEHERAVDPQLVHQLQARSRLPEGRDAAHRLADELAVRLALGVPVAEVLLLGTGSGHDFERRVGDVVADRAPDHDLGAPVQVDVVDGALVAVGQVTGEGVPRLVEVVVRVEDREVAGFRHGNRGYLILTTTSISENGRPPSWPPPKRP